MIDIYNLSFSKPNMKVMLPNPFSMTLILMVLSQVLYIQGAVTFHKGSMQNQFSQKLFLNQADESIECNPDLPVLSVGDVNLTQ